MGSDTEGQVLNHVHNEKVKKKPANCSVVWMSLVPRGPCWRLGSQRDGVEVAGP
jgi:hypothetical protein